jgi:hypothetical protein
VSITAPPCVKLNILNRTSAPLLGAIAVCLIGLAVACGGGSTTSDIGNGPAVNVKGVWERAYTGQDAAHSGTFCVDFQKDNRQISGGGTFSGNVSAGTASGSFTMTSTAAGGRLDRAHV